MDLPMLGTAEQTDDSKFQVMLVDKMDKTLHPMQYPRINRFFENITDRNAFVRMFEQSITKSGGRLVKHEVNHPLFTSFDIFNKEGEQDYAITIYH